MKNKTKIAFGLGALCAGIGVYVYMRNKENLGECEVFSQDFYDDVKDGTIQEEKSTDGDESTECTEDFVI